MHVTHFINSYVNRPGNIGLRTGYILKYLQNEATCVCRGAIDKDKSIDFLEMGLLGHIPRLLNGLRIHLLPSFDHRVWDIALFQWFAKRQLKKIKTDVAHVWDFCPALIAQLKSAGIPVVLDMPMAPSFYAEKLYAHGKADFLRASKKIQSMEYAAIAAADLIISPSSFVADELIEMGVNKNRIAVVEFGVENPFKEAIKTYSNMVEKKGLDICFMGNINRRKGVSELLSVWRDPVFSHDRLHLCGRINKDIKNLLPSLGSENILTPGFVNSFDYMLNCDVFVLPSWQEGSSKAVYEAMSIGLPSIVTHSSGSVIRDGIDGFVIDAGDSSSLKERMMFYKKNPEQIEIMGRNAKEHVQQFTWSRYANKVMQHYYKLRNC